MATYELCGDLITSKIVPSTWSVVLSRCRIWSLSLDTVRVAVSRAENCAFFQIIQFKCAFYMNAY